MALGGPGAASGAAKNWVFFKNFEILEKIAKNRAQGGGKWRKLILRHEYVLLGPRRPF